ncbi:helix-turn-helix domain-containing protein [Leptospira dzoumogneensis]|uniref:helix-turn-helix domain-containing protein n=1 Tax=Leptospira dzoumogneensis TaxID=2484904 RepID=UPI00142E4A68|nr:helix-turn-helix transcriptional regulator [Leptospira dzoumogneensis]
MIEKITIISGSLSLFLFLGEGISKEKYPWRLYLIVIYLSHSFFMLLGWAIFSGHKDYAATLIYFAGPIMFCHAWALPRSLRCISNLATLEELKRDFASVIKDFFPCLISFAIILPTYFINYDHRFEFLNVVTSGTNSKSVSLIPPLVLISAILYQIYGLGVTYFRSRNFLLGMQGRIIRIVSGLLIIRSLFGFAERAVSKTSYLDLHILSSGIIIPLFFLLYKRYISYQLRKGYEIQKPYKQSRLNEIDLDELEERLQMIMQRDRIYTEESITLADLAKYADVTVHQLSEYLNVKKGISFRNYINEWRVNLACEMLKTKPEMSILDIAYECGFKAKSSFHLAFQKHTGMHPKKFRAAIDF